MDADYSAWSREVEEEGSKNREMAALGSHFKEYSERDDEPGEGFKKQGSVCIVSEALSGCSCQVYAGGRAGAEAEDARGGDGSANRVRLRVTNVLAQSRNALLPLASLVAMS